MLQRYKIYLKGCIATTFFDIFQFISKFIFLVNSGTNNMHINIYNETNTVQKRKKDSKEMVNIKWFQQ